MAKITQKCGDFYYTVDTNETQSNSSPLKAICVVLLCPIIMILGLFILGWLASFL